MNRAVRGVELHFDYGEKIWRVGTRDTLSAGRKTQEVLEGLCAKDPSFQYRVVSSGELREEQDIRYQSTQSASQLRPQARLRADLELLYRALKDDRIDFFVEERCHLPFRLPSSFKVAAYLPRKDPRELLVLKKGLRYEDLKREGAQLGSLRVGEERQAFQLARILPKASVQWEPGGTTELLQDVCEGRSIGAVVSAFDLLHSAPEPYREKLSFFPFATGVLCPPPGQGQMVLVQRRSRIDQWRSLRHRFERFRARQAYLCEGRLAMILTGVAQDPQRKAAVHVSYAADGTVQLCAVNTASRKEDPKRVQQALAEVGRKRIEPERERRALRGLLGEVAFVGAGPGPADLLTVKALRRIQEADVLVYDDPSSAVLLAQCSCQGEQIDLRETLPPQDPEPAEDFARDAMLRLLLDKVRRGLDVVRLCAGDPWLIGPASGEALGLAKAGVPFLTIPGVTSVSAVSHYAGLPLTLPGLADSLHILNGLRPFGDADSAYSRREHFRRLVSLGGTLVFLMPITQLPTLCSELIAGGMDPATHALLVENASSLRQRRLQRPLSELAKEAVRLDFLPPALLVLSPNLIFAQALRWWPPVGTASGRRILLLKSRPLDRVNQARIRRLERDGAAVLELEMVWHVADAAVLSRLDRDFRELMAQAARERLLEKGGLVFTFTSPRAVEAFGEMLRRAHFDLRRMANARVAAYGEDTLAALQHMGLHADLTPEIADMEHLADCLTAKLGRHDLLAHVRGSIDNAILPLQLRLHGIRSVDLVVYETYSHEASRKTLLAWLPGATEIFFASPAAVHAYMDALAERSCPAPENLRLVPLTPAAASALLARKPSMRGQIIRDLTEEGGD